MKKIKEITGKEFWASRCLIDYGISNNIIYYKQKVDAYLAYNIKMLWPLNRAKNVVSPLVNNIDDFNGMLKLRL